MYRISPTSNNRLNYECQYREPLAFPEIGCTFAWQDKKYAILPMRYGGGNHQPNFWQSLDNTPSQVNNLDVFERRTTAVNLGKAFSSMGLSSLTNPWNYCYADPGCDEPSEAGPGIFSPVPPVIPFVSPTLAASMGGSVGPTGDTGPTGPIGPTGASTIDPDSGVTLDVIVSASLSNNNLVFTRKRVWALKIEDADSINIPVTDCD